MKVLLDENLPHALRNYLPGHEAVTAAYAGLAGYKNGQLLQAAMEAEFDVLVTADKTLEHEQNFENHRIALVSVSVNAWRLMRPCVAKIAQAVDQARPGTITRVDCGVFERPAREPGSVG